MFVTQYRFPSLYAVDKEQKCLFEFANKKTNRTWSWKITELKMPQKPINKALF